MKRLDEHLATARAQHIQKAKERADAQLFLLNWRSGGQSEVTGFATLAALLDFKISTIRVRLSNGGGAFSIQRNNPTTGEPDILTVTRVAAPAPPAKKPRGRPRTRPLADDPRLGEG